MRLFCRWHGIGLYVLQHLLRLYGQENCAQSMRVLNGRRSKTVLLDWLAHFRLSCWKNLVSVTIYSDWHNLFLTYWMWQQQQQQNSCLSIANITQFVPTWKLNFPLRINCAVIFHGFQLFDSLQFNPYHNRFAHANTDVTQIQSNICRTFEMQAQQISSDDWVAFW